MSAPLRAIVVVPAPAGPKTKRRGGDRRSIPAPASAELLSAAGALRSAGCSVLVVIDEGDPAPVAEALRGWKSDLIVLGADADRWASAQDLAARLRRTRDVPVLLHGDFARHFPNEALEQLPQAAAAVACEGEDALVEAVNRLRLDAPLTGVTGLAVRGPDGIELPLERPPVPGLWPHPPAWELLPRRRSGGRWGPLPVRLTLGKDRAPAEVVSELLQRAALSWQELPVELVDDDLAGDTPWLSALCTSLENASDKARWSLRLAQRHATPGLLGRLERAGCRRVDLGDSPADGSSLGHPAYPIDGTRMALQEARRAGLGVGLRLTVGAPGSTPASLDAALDLAASLPLDRLHLKLYRPPVGAPGWQLSGGAAQQFLRAATQPDRAVHRPDGYASLLQVEQDWRRAVDRGRGLKGQLLRALVGRGR